MRSDFSKTVTEWPARLSWSAAARPAGPEPTTATFLQVRVAGVRGVTHPSSHARSMIDASIDLIVTGSSLMPRTHAPFARRGTQLARELREVVGRVQAIDRRAPAIAVDEIVPVGNQVAERTALMTERNAAVHAARALLPAARRRGTADTPRASPGRARSTGRVGCFLRWISMNPVGLPMDGRSRARRRCRPPASRPTVQRAAPVPRSDAVACSASARLYSRGITFTMCRRTVAKSASNPSA